MKCYQCQSGGFQFWVNDTNGDNVSFILTLIFCSTNTTLSAECATGATITPPRWQYEPGDVLTCSANGDDPTYTWTGIFNGVAIAPHTGSTYTLLEGDFDLTCTTKVTQSMCIDVTQSVEGSAIPEPFGK